MASRIALCIEEMAGNTIQHGFARDDRRHHLNVRVICREGYWILRFRDDCRAFDPVDYLPGHERDALGIRLVLAMAEDASYTYTLNLNNLALRLPANGGAPVTGRAGRGG